MPPWESVEHGRLSSEEILEWLARHKPGDRLWFDHPVAEGKVYVKIITKLEYDSDDP